ncbi:MAG: hypothetical protein Q8N85_00655 [Candidatus Omnitrophota bacterium]|nr:hypothetical protein [Candidatus Omnitrophota bacterium]
MQHSSFNPKARWDRNIPQQAGTHHNCRAGLNLPYNNPEELNEKIEVFAWFRNAKIYPRMFVWNHRRYRVQSVTYNWQERSGSAVISRFSVNTGSDLYQISFNNATYGWQLDRIIA